MLKLLSALSAALLSTAGKAFRVDVCGADMYVETLPPPQLQRTAFQKGARPSATIKTTEWCAEKYAKLEAYSVAA